MNVVISAPLSNDDESEKCYINGHSYCWNWNSSKYATTKLPYLKQQMKFASACNNNHTGRSMMNGSHQKWIQYAAIYRL